LPHGRSSYFEIYHKSQPVGLASVFDIIYGPLKFGLIIRGPGIVVTDLPPEGIVKVLKMIQTREKYVFLRVNPNVSQPELTKSLRGSKYCLEVDAFPIYKGSQAFDNIIELNRSEEDIIRRYSTDARRKIKLGREENFVVKELTTIEEFDEMYNLFTDVGKRKGFVYRSKDSYFKIWKGGKNYGLSTIYGAYYADRLVSAVFTVSDKILTTNHSSASISDVRFKSRNSPSALLHHSIILESNKQGKSQYNISYSDPKSNVGNFKGIFKPNLVLMPPHFTFGQKWLIKLFLLFNRTLMPKLKRIIKRNYGNKK
jgi:hypothetical protein